MMQAGEVAGCVIPDELIRRLEKEKKPQRLERAALMVAAAKSLGFAGAHVGGFGLTHKDFMTIMERAAALSGEWRNKLDELIFPYPNEFYLLPQATDGLSDGTGDYQVTHTKPHATFVQWLSKQVHQHLIAEGSFGHRFFSARLKPNGDGAPGLPGVMACGTGCWSLPRFIAKPLWDAEAAAIVFRTTSTTQVAQCAGVTKSFATALAEVRESMEPARRGPSSFAFGT